MIDKKYTLAKMYGRMKGYEPDEMSDEQFQRKRDLCQEVLKVLDKIMPGRSRKRGRHSLSVSQRQIREQFLVRQNP
jgi:hypothetical protein